MERLEAPASRLVELLRWRRPAGAMAAAALLRRGECAEKKLHRTPEKDFWKNGGRMADVVRREAERTTDMMVTAKGKGGRGSCRSSSNWRERNQLRGDKEEKGLEFINAGLSPIYVRGVEDVDVWFKSDVGRSVRPLLARAWRGSPPMARS